MAEAIGTQDLEEILRLQREAEERAREEAERAQAEAQKAQEQAEAAAAEGQKAAQEAEANAKAQTEQAAANAAPAVTPEQTIQNDFVPLRNDVEDAGTNPVVPGTPEVRDTGMGFTEQEKTDARFMRDVRRAVMNTNFKVQQYDTEDGYDSSLKKNQLAGKLVMHAADLPSESESGNIVSIRYGSVKNKEQGFMLLMTGSDNGEKVKIGKELASRFNMPVDAFLAEAENYVYDQFGRQMFSTPYSNAAKVRTYNAGLKNIGLTDVDGTQVDITSANPADVIRASRMDPNGATAEQVYKYAKKLSETPGSKWYGIPVSADMFSFVESSELTKKQYDDAVKKFNTSFSYTDGFDEANLAKYLKNYEYIVNRYGENERVFGYMFRELNESYTAHTGLNPMTREMADKALAETAEQRMLVSETADSEENAEKGILEVLSGWASGAVDWIKGLGKAEKPEEKGELTTVDEILKELDEKQSSSSGGSVVASGGTISVGGQTASVSKPIASVGMPSTQELFPDGGAEAEPEFDNPLGISEEKLAEVKKGSSDTANQDDQYIESLPYDPNMTDEQAWAAQQAGYQLHPKNFNQISRFAHNSEINGVTYGETAVTPENAIGVYRRHGEMIGQTAMHIKSSNAPKEVKASAELALMSLTERIFESATTADPNNQRPAGMNMYDWEFKINSDFVEELDKIRAMVDDLDSGYAEAVVEEADERSQRMEEYKQRWLSGERTPEIVDALTDYYQYDWIDLTNDATCNRVRKDLAETGDFYSPDGSFWKGDSLAAREHSNILTASGKRGAMDFRKELKLFAIDMVEDYVRAAINIGADPEEFLASAGITSTEQLLDIAYNCMKSEGNEILNDPELREAANTFSDQPATVGDVIMGKNRVSAVEQAGLAGSSAWTDYVEGFAHASYNAVDLATHLVSVDRIKRHYIDKYDEWRAPAMYRRDLNALLASDVLSQEQKEDLARDISRAYSIFDVGYEIDPGGLKGFLREEVTLYQKRLERLDSVIETLTPDQQRTVRLASSMINSGLGMFMSMGGTRFAKAAGMGARGARIFGEAIGTGVGVYDDCQKQNKRAGMGDGFSSLYAVFEAAGSTLVESMNLDSFTNLVFGDIDVSSVTRMLRKNPKNVLRAAGKLAVKGLADAAGEGVEEDAQHALQTLFDFFDPVLVAHENGERLNLSKVYGIVRDQAKNLNGEQFYEELKQNFGGGMAVGMFYSLIGIARSGLTIAGDIKAFNNYESVKMATKIAEGELPATKENLGKLYDLVDKDRMDPEFNGYLDRGSLQAQKDNQVITAMLEGTEIDTLNGAVDHAEKAKEYGEKKEAAQNAIDTAQSRWVELRQQVMSGNLDAVPAMTTAQQQLAKARTAHMEASNAEAMHKEKASIGTDKWLKACTERAAILTSEGINYRMNRIAVLRDVVAKRLMDQDIQAKAEQRRIEEEADLEVLGMTDEEIDAEIADMAELDSRVATAEAESEAMGYDEETMQALAEQAEQERQNRKNRHDAIVRNQRNQYKSLSDRMVQAQELEDPDAYGELESQRKVVEDRLAQLGADPVDPNAEANAKAEARIERATDIVTGTTKEQRDAVAAEQREQGNLDLMDAQEYVEQAHPDASDEEKQKLIDQYLSRVETRRQAKDTKTNEADVDMEALGKGVEFVTRLSKKFGFEVKLVDADDPRLSGAEGAYDPETNSILLPKNITQSEAVRRVLLHEMTHFSESGKGKYKNLRKALFKLEYGDDNGRLEADIDSKIQTYNKHFEAKKIRGKDGNIRKIDREGAMQELTAEICSKVLEGKEEMIDRLVSDSPSAARQIMDGIRNFINRLRGINDPEIDKARRVVRLFEKALKKAQKVSGRSGEMQYATKSDVDARDKEYFDNIDQHDDIKIYQAFREKVPRHPGGGINLKEIMKVVRENPLVEKIGTHYVAECPDIAAKVELNADGIKHGYGTAASSKPGTTVEPFELLNARAAMMIPELLQNAVEVNRSDKYTEKGHDYGHVLMSAYSVKEAKNQIDYYAVRMVVEHNSDRGVYELVDYGVVGQLHAINAKKIPLANVQLPNKRQLGGQSVSTYRIADLIKDVNVDLRDTFTNEAYAKVGYARRKTSFASKLKYSLPSEDQIAKEIDTWIDSRQVEMNAAKSNDGRSQYPDTSAKSAGVPDAIKREIDTNPIFRSYKKDSNDAQFERAMDRVKKNGYTEEVERLLDADHFTTDDSVEAGALAIAAFESGDIATGLSLMAKDEVNVREAARTMQVRQAFAKMTPTHVMAKVGGEMEVKLSDIEKEFGQMANDVKRMAREHDVKIKDLMGGSELGKIAAKGEYTISSKNNKWGIPLNEKQMELIKQFKLEKVARPGIHYNRATIEQRMLEAIIATPDPDADTGNGRTLTERLEWMKRGKPVGTVADLRYIADNIAAYTRLSEVDKNSREARVALGRALEAYGNITPKTLGQKIRTQRYVNMLLSFTSSERNVIGNVGQNVVNAATHDTFGVFTDWATSLITGKREVMPISIKERINGFRAFADGLGEVFKDTFVDQVNASAVDTEDAKFDGGMDGRVFQKAKIPVVGNIPIVGDLLTDFAENARNLEGFLMSYGDRSVYKAAFANSIAEQTRIAEEKGVPLDWDAAVEQAKKDANYATFNESGELRSALEQLRNKSSLARFFMDLYTPFVGIPLNIAKRGFIEYSPINVLGAIGGAIKNAADGRAFDQKRFVDGVSKGLGGTALMLAGMWLKANGYFMPGTGEEDDEKLYNLRAAMGEQYSPFIRVGDEYYSLSVLAPVIYPVTLGATIYDMLTEEDKALGDMAIDAGVALVNQFFDASFMSGLADLFDTSNSSFGESLMKTVPETLMSQMLPYGTALGQWATASDPYVRDTKDASAIRSAFNKSVIARIPEARETLLPTKNDIAGQAVESKEGIRNFIDPFYTTKANDDPAFKELDRLYDETGSSSHIPTYLIKTSGKVQILAKIADDDSVNMNRGNNEHKLVLTANERNHYNQMYGQLVFDGTGDKTYEGVGGIETEFAGIRDVMNSADYEYASDEEKADMISEVLSMAKMLTQAQIVIDKGYVK